MASTNASPSGAERSRLVVVPDHHRVARCDQTRSRAGRARGQPVLQRERRPTDAGRAGLDRDGLAVEDRGPVGDARLGQDQALRALVTGRDRLAGHVGPVPDAGHLAVGQVDRVVDVAHRIGIGEADVDLDAMREIAGQIARVNRGLDP